MLARASVDARHLASRRGRRAPPLPAHDLSGNENNSIFQLGFFRLPISFQQSELVTLGYQFEKDYILSSLFPEILTSVELGRDVFVGILGDKDSLLYLQHSLPISNYLAVTPKLSK